MEEILCPISNQPVADCGSYYFFPGLPNLRCYKTMFSREMSPKDYAAIFNGESPTFDFVSQRTAKPFKAKLQYNPASTRFDLVFAQQTQGQQLELHCPLSNLPIIDLGNAFRFPGYPNTLFFKQILGKQLSATDYQKILTQPNPVHFSGFTSKNTGRAFSAGLYYDPMEKRVKFAFKSKDAKKVAPSVPSNTQEDIPF